MGKYQVDQIYTITSLTGESWKIKIKITNIFTVPIKNLTHFGIPKKSVNSLLTKTKLKNNALVELIKFKYI